MNISREVRLRPEFSHLYPGIHPGDWLDAETVAAGSKRRDLASGLLRARPPSAARNTFRVPRSASGCPGSQSPAPSAGGSNALSAGLRSDRLFDSANAAAYESKSLRGFTAAVTSRDQCPNSALQLMRRCGPDEL